MSERWEENPTGLTRICEEKRMDGKNALRGP